MQYGDDFYRKFGTFTGDPNFTRPNPFEGAPGFVRSIMPYAATPMNPPTNLTADSEIGYISLDWIAPETNDGGGGGAGDAT